MVGHGLGRQILHGVFLPKRHATRFQCGAQLLAIEALLLAHEHLLRVMGLVERLGDTGDVPAPRKSTEVGAIFDELDTLLERTTALTEHTAAMIDELRRE